MASLPRARAATAGPAIAIPCGKVGGPRDELEARRHLEDALRLRAAYAFPESVDWEPTRPLISGAPVAALA